MQGICLLHPILSMYLNLPYDRIDFDHAAQIFGADEARPIEDLPLVLKTLSAGYSHVYADNFSSRRGRQRSLMRYLTAHSTSRLEYNSVIDSISNTKCRNLAAEVGKLRCIKSKAEQRLMRLAADASGLAHAKVSVKMNYHL